MSKEPQQKLKGHLVYNGSWYDYQFADFMSEPVDVEVGGFEPPCAKG